MKKVLFVCSGNYYRSRLAEILFNHHAATAGIPWRAESRGLLETPGLTGISEHALEYLRSCNLEELTGALRDPQPLTADDFQAADLFIAMCRQEHQPMMEARFLALAKTLHRTRRLRYWNIYDIPLRPRALVRLLGGGHRQPSQPPDSGTEHVDMAVRLLVDELAAEE